MNKKKALLLITSLSLVSGAMAVVFASNGLEAQASGITRGVSDNYTLSVTSGSVEKDINGFSITNERGTDFYFGVNSNPKPQMKGEDYVVRYYGNQWGVNSPVALIKCENNAVDSTHPVNGIKSITVNYSGKVGTGSDPSRPDTELTVKYGFVHDGICNYVYEDVLPASGSSFNFGNLLPNCFVIECDNEGTEQWYEAKIESFSINYSCSESDATKNAWLDEYFATTPKNIVRDGEDKVVSFESGAYPQSKADMAALSYLEVYYSSLTPIFADYYCYNGSLYQRAQAKATGYNSEYTVDNYYWFKVEPLKWNVVQIGSYYLATTEKVLNGKLAYHTNGSATSVKYRESTLKTTVDAMFDVMFKNVGSLIKNLDDTHIEGKLYPLSFSQYGGTNSERISLPTEYARLFSSYSSLTEGAQYWTNRIGYNNADNKNYVVGATGLLTASTQNLAIAGVRPGITIEIE